MSPRTERIFHSPVVDHEGKVIDIPWGRKVGPLTSDDLNEDGKAWIGLALVQGAYTVKYFVERHSMTETTVRRYKMATLESKRVRKEGSNNV